MEFSKRIEKLESDIHLISSIRDILMLNNSSFYDNQGDGSREVDVPVRDSGDGDKNKKSCATKISSNTTSRKTIPRPTARKTSSINTKSIKDSALSDEIIQKNQECMEKLQEEIATEIKNRFEAEESAKLVVIRLQKVEDDLRREKEIKKSLLEGTLQMKNQMQGYHSEISTLDKRVTDLQTENDRLVNDLKSLEEIKLQEFTQSQAQIQLLELEKAKLINQGRKLESEIQVLTAKNSEIHSKLQRTQQVLSTQDDQIRTKLQESEERLNLSEDRKQKVEQQLQLVQNRTQLLQEKLKSSNFKIKNQQQEFSLQLKEKEEQIKALNSMLKQERASLSQKIDAATALVSRTKSFIIGLQNEKQVQENLAQKYLLDIRQLQQEKSEANKRIQELKNSADHQDNFRERFYSLNRKSEEKTRTLEQERENLKQQLKHEHDKVLDLKKSHESLHQELSNALKKYEEEKISGESAVRSLRDEHKKVSDNLQILQKISEDQGKTISKQRNELEMNSELRYKLELQLRESAETEKALIIRLRDEENSNKELERQISHFEQQISIMNKEVKSHDCEEFVESKFHGKVKELERKVRNLEGEIKSKEEERGKALAAARKAVSQATQLKDSFEQKIINIKTFNSNEILKIRQGNQQQEAERNKKICDLESEILRMRESGRQMQNAYLAKIQQLQNALTACCGGVGSNIGNGISNQQQGFNFGFPFHQQTSCAANFGVPSGFNTGSPFI